jgi:putative heme transporter
MSGQAGSGAQAPGDVQAPDAPAVAAAGRRPRRGWQIAAALAAAAAISFGVYAGRHTLAESLNSLASLDWTWFLAALAFEALSLTAFGLSRRRLLRADGQRVRLGSVMAIDVASNALSISVPFAGAQLALVFSYQQYRRRGLGQAVTGWALAVSAIMSVSALALVLIGGSLLGGASLTTALGFAGAAVMLVPGVAILLALRSPRMRQLISVAVARLTAWARRLLRRPAPDGVAADGFEEFLERVASIRMPPARYAEVFALAVLNWVGDCACLACSIHAAGQPVPWHGLLLAYAAGAAVGSTGLTPGGFGLVEATLTAALVGVGMTSGGALTAVLAYRLCNFWLILIGGWITMVVLTRFRSRTARSPGIPAGPG